MSTAEILSLVSVISFVFCGIAFVLAVFFWFFFKIPAVIGDLSGRTARKSIEKMRAGNEKAAAQGYRPKTSYTTYQAATTTVKLQTQHPTTVRLKRLVEEPTPPEQLPETNLLDESGTPTEEIPATELLCENAASIEEIPATELLDENAASIEEIPATELLNVNNDFTEELPATELLESTAITESLLDEDEREPLPPAGGVAWTMLDEVMLVHTDETIL